jgi:hypothetical protein
MFGNPLVKGIHELVNFRYCNKSNIQILMRAADRMSEIHMFDKRENTITINRDVKQKC